MLFFVCFFWALERHLYDGLEMIIYDYQNKRWGVITRCWRSGIPGKWFSQNRSHQGSVNYLSFEDSPALPPFCPWGNWPPTPESFPIPPLRLRDMHRQQQQHLMSFSPQTRLDMGYSYHRHVAAPPEMSLNKLCCLHTWTEWWCSLQTAVVL